MTKLSDTIIVELLPYFPKAIYAETRVRKGELTLVFFLDDTRTHDSLYVFSENNKLTGYNYIPCELYPEMNDIKEEINVELAIHSTANDLVISLVEKVNEMVTNNIR